VLDCIDREITSVTYEKGEVHTIEDMMAIKREMKKVVDGFRNWQPQRFEFDDGANGRAHCEFIDGGWMRIQRSLKRQRDPTYHPVFIIGTVFNKVYILLCNVGRLVQLGDQRRKSGDSTLAESDRELSNKLHSKAVTLLNVKRTQVWEMFCGKLPCKPLVCKPFKKSVRPFGERPEWLPDRPTSPIANSREGLERV
jgi:hypothetical protein